MTTFKSLAAEAAHSFAPLALQFTKFDHTRQWSLTFMASPKPEILLAGDTPTRDEIIETLMPLHAPVWLVPVIEVVVASVRPTLHVDQLTALGDPVGDITSGVINPPEDFPTTGAVKLDSPGSY